MKLATILAIVEYRLEKKGMTDPRFMLTTPNCDEDITHVPVDGGLETRFGVKTAPATASADFLYGGISVHVGKRQMGFNVLARKGELGMLEHVNLED